MNRAYNKLSVLVFSAMITTSVVGMELEQATEQVTPAAWYKKGSVQVAAAAITLAAVGYAYAVRMDKALIPAFITTLFAAKLVQDQVPKSDTIDDAPEQIIEVKNQEINVGETVEISEQTKSFNDMVNKAIEFVKHIKLPTWDEYKTTVQNMTEEDFKQMNEDLVR
jgi:hypothetical protein